MTPGRLQLDRLCVYTLLIGDYESLNEQPVARLSNVPFICLTDNPTLTSASWTIVQVAPAFPMDPIRSQRILKICPHRIPALSQFDHSLYIDNSVILREPPEAFIGKLPAASGLGVPGHSFRHSVHDEFLEVARLGLDDQGRIFEQLHHYLADGDAALDEKPHWTAMLLRDHRDAHVRRTMALWAAHVLRYSRRDQLSFNTAVRATQLTPDRWEIDNFQSFFHTWPHTPGRERFAGTRNPQTASMPLPSQLAHMRKEVSAAHVALDVARQDANALREHLVANTALLADADAKAREQSTRAENTAQQLAVADLRHRETTAAASERIRVLEQHLARSHDDTRETLQAIHASTSWRLTAPLRAIKRWLT